MYKQNKKNVNMNHLYILELEYNIISKNLPQHPILIFYRFYGLYLFPLRICYN